MKKLLLIFIICITGVSFSSGQGTIRGKITDKNGETVIGAPVVLKTDRSVGITTDLDGNYSLYIKATGPQTILVTYMGYKPIEYMVDLKNNEVIIKNFIIESATQALNEVEIVGKVSKARDNYMEKIKTNSAVTLDYISSETMKKTGDANVVAAVARVSGVSTNGGFITVRGIGDRYIKTTINGSRIPTLDPFTNNIKLDLFPASLIDNVIITKTENPDLPGDWSGAYLSVETKDYPEQLAVNIETTFGYNAQSTFKDYISSQHSSTEWLGYDNSFRDHDHNSFVTANTNPSQYQQFVALGLGSYFNSIGVTAENWTQDHANGDTYFRLGLVQLGLLPSALINDNGAYINAKNLYDNGTYKSDAFKTLNSGVPQSSGSFPANWNTTTRRAPLNFSQGFSIGNQIKMFGKPLGFIAGFRYGNSVQYDSEATSNRASLVGKDGDTTGVLVRAISSALTQQSSVETNGWSALINLAYKLNTNNSISILFMPNFTGINKVRKSYDVGNEHTVVTFNQFYEQRKQLVYQFKSEHYLPGPKIKIELNASYTNGKSSAPDFKNLQFWKNADTTYQIDPAIGDGMSRNYRYLSDNLFDSRLSFEIPLKSKPDLTRKIKIGGAYQQNDKKNDQYSYEVFFGPNKYPLLNEDIDAYLNPGKFDIRTDTNTNGYISNTLDAFYVSDPNPAYHTFGNSSIKAGFVLIDYSFIPSLRFSGGLRVEQTHIFTDVNEFYALGLPANDLRRVYSDAYPIANPGKLDKTNYLPSASLIYKIKDNEKHTINLRVNYSQTVAHPSIRELSDIAIYEYEYRTFVYGNSNLKSVRINNYDLRFETYFKSNDNISLSLFYKDFKNHIEFVGTTGGNTWQNVAKSNVKGIEIEGRKVITKQLEFSANVTLTWSETKYIRTRQDFSGGLIKYIPEDTIKRTMFGQAPYVINGILSYTTVKPKLTVTLSYNVQGPRLVLVSDNKEIPDIYELPRNLFDFKITKPIFKHFTLSLTIKDILNTSVRRAYNYQEGFNVLDYDKYTYGTNYLLGISYKL